MQGDLPSLDMDLAEGTSKDRVVMWVDSPAAPRKGQRLGGEASVSKLVEKDDDLEAAIALSLRPDPSSIPPSDPSPALPSLVPGPGIADDGDEDLEAAIALSLRADSSLPGAPAPSPVPVSAPFPVDLEDDDDNDEDLEAAIALSMQDANPRP